MRAGPPGPLPKKVLENGLAHLEEAIKATPRGAIRERAIERID